MSKIRVLVVDDAVVIRRLLTEELGRDPALEVVGAAANGKIALTKLPQLKPDAVILDIEMPEMDGLQTLKEIRKTHRRLPVIMFSSMTERGAAVTLDALALGASDYFTKPTTAGIEESLEVVREQLIPKIKALCASATVTGLTSQIKSITAAAKPAHLPQAPSYIAPSAHKQIKLVAIGASTGGPVALAELLGKLPVQFPVPIVIVQHMPPLFTRLLAERLSTQTPFKVQEGASGVLLQGGEAWVAPGDHHMIVIRDGVQGRLLIHQDEKENSCRPSVDVLFRSVAKTYGSQALVIMLTGMGHDGIQGCAALREAGGTILVQDEASSVVWGMPGGVAKAGLADSVLPIPRLADEIVRLTR
jgi:two-component system chemotaxis response regulator CheB